MAAGGWDNAGVLPARRAGFNDGGRLVPAPATWEATDGAPYLTVEWVKLDTLTHEDAPMRPLLPPLLYAAVALVSGWDIRPVEVILCYFLAMAALWLALDADDEEAGQ